MPISAKSPPRLSGVSAPLAALVRTALAVEGRRPGELGIVLTGDAPVRELNRRWRGLDRATDILSFSYDTTPGPFVNGDLIVSMDRVIEQARRFRVTRGRELARLVIHGALHLTGLDHQTSVQRRRMRSRERVLLRAGAAQIRALERALDRPGAKAAPARRTAPRSIGRRAPSGSAARRSGPRAAPRSAARRTRAAPPSTPRRTGGRAAR
jgi:probable rRNA maturation factor